MGNCMTCFKEQRQSPRSRINSCKEYPVIAQETAIINNNYTGPPYPHNHHLHHHPRDALEQSEIQGLLSPSPQNEGPLNHHQQHHHPHDTTKKDPTLVSYSSTNSGVLSSSSSGVNLGLGLAVTPVTAATGTLSSCSTSSSSSSALKLLKKPMTSQISDNKINALFETYRDEECQDAILAPGIERLCCDLRYKPEDFAVLVLAWRLDASQMCRFTKTEFIQGLHTLNADSIDSIRQRLEQEVQRLARDTEAFKNLYRFTFKFGLEHELRTLPLDMAISLWRLVFTVHTPAILDKWLDYLTANPQQIRGIPKDTWNMFLNFVETCDIYSYSDEDAWPSVFDDFVEYENERRKDQQTDRVLPSTS